MQQEGVLTDDYLLYSNFLEVFTHYNIFCRIEDDLDIVRVSSAGYVIVYHPLRIPIHVQKLLQEIVYTLVIVVFSTKAGLEVAEGFLRSNMNGPYLFLKEILLIKKKNHT